ncbi:MAG: hypothetical protein ACYCV7_16070 [Acidimicrobiales bacterium]
MRNRTKWVVAGSSVLGVAAMMTAGVGATSAQPPVASIRLAAANGPAGAAGADQAAVSYVNANYPGSGTANVLVTSPDVEHGVPVYDIRIVAPSGTTYVVHVQRSNDAVLSANLAETQVTTPPVTTTPVTTTPVTTTPVTTTPVTTTPVTTPQQPVQAQQPVQPAQTPEPVQAKEPAQAPEPVQAKEPAQAPSNSGNSVDTQGNTPSGSTSSSGKSVDHQGKSPDKAKSTTKKSDG